MKNTNEMILLTDGKRKLYIEGKGFLNFLKSNGVEHLYDETIIDKEELTDIFQLVVVNDNVPGYMVLGYYIDRLYDNEEVTPATIFVVIDEGRYDTVTFYAPVGQHSEGDRGYIEECTPITKEEYLNISKGIFTPKEYL